jgi:hypothetical protein
MIDPKIDSVLIMHCRKYAQFTLEFGGEYARWQDALVKGYSYLDDQYEKVSMVPFPRYIEGVAELLECKPNFDAHVQTVVAAWRSFIERAEETLEYSTDDEYMEEQWEQYYQDDYDTFEEFKRSPKYDEVSIDDQQQRWDDFSAENEDMIKMYHTCSPRGYLVDSYNNVDKTIIDHIEEAADEIRKELDTFTTLDEFLTEDEMQWVVESVLS